MIRVLLVDDHASYREPLAGMLELEGDIQVVAEAETLGEARGKLTDIDVAVIDLDLPDGNGLDLVRELHATSEEAAALVLTASVDHKSYARAVEAGAAGVLHKSRRVREVVSAVRSLHAGEMLFSRAELIEMLRMANEERQRDQAMRQGIESLTPREREILQAAAEGLDDRGIAERLSIGVPTVRSHLGSIRGKLNVSSKMQAVLVAVRYGIVKLD